MKSITRFVTATVAIAGLSLGLTATADAQAGKAAGVVTSLQGTANLQRVSTTEPAPQVLPLKFRDEVRVADRITTGDQSIARILLGGKAVVTVREHSSLTITEQQGASTIDITAGKIALAVAKERLSPGERIDIKTPNAVAGVRGTVVITEVGQFTAQAGGTPSGGVNTRFTLLTGALEVNPLDPSGRRGPAFTMGPLQQLSLTGFTPPSGPRNITPAQGQAAANDFKVTFKDAPQGSNSQISDRQVEQATNAAAAATGGVGSGGGTTIINTTNNPVSKPTDPQKIYPTGETPMTATSNAALANTTPINNGGTGGPIDSCLCPAEGRAARTSTRTSTTIRR